MYDLILTYHSVWNWNIEFKKCLHKYIELYWYDIHKKWNKTAIYYLWHQQTEHFLHWPTNVFWNTHWLYIDAKEFTYDENSVMMKTLRECFAIIFVHFILYSKYSKHWLSTVTHTIDCVRSKILNYSLNHGYYFHFSSFFGEKTF